MSLIPFSKFKLVIYKYIDYGRKVKSLIKQMAKEEDICRLYLYFDYTWCLLRYGCLVNQYHRGHFYKMPLVVKRKSFTQRRLIRIMNNYNDSNCIYILLNKNVFNDFYKEFVHRKWLYSEDMNYHDFRELFDSCTELFVKPLDDQEGHGIYKISTEGKRAEDFYKEVADKKVVIEESISQHPDMIFGNASVNSARVLTVTDTKGKAYVVRAGLRVGVGEAVVDNFTAGGVLYQIDIESGRINHKGIQGSNYDIIFHPGTEICMLGYKIPNWKRAIDSVVKAAEMLPQCRFIGWDVAFTPEGIELIEGNHNPGIFTLESLGSPGAYADVKRILKS